jgi:hypothetical protein
MTLYVGLRNYSDIKTGLRVRKGEPVEIADGHVAEHLVGDLFGPVPNLAAELEMSLIHKPEMDSAAPELDIEIDLGTDDLSQKPNRKRTAQKDRT